MPLEKFTTLAMLRRGGRTGFVKVHVAPDSALQKKYRLKTREQYEAFVHYTLARSEQFLDTVLHGVMPEVILFGEQEHPTPTHIYDFTGKHGVTPNIIPWHHCVCLAPCNGIDSYCCVYWVEDDDAQSE
jgi:hypothetical protein